MTDQRACPVCGTTADRTLFRQQFHTISGASLMDGYDLVLCPQCGCAFADHIPEQETFDGYYRALSKYEYHQRGGQVSASDQLRFHDIADLLQRYLPGPETRILDIGCATG